MFESLEIMRDHAQSSYPNDLENLIHYLRINSKSNTSHMSGKTVKTSSFASGKRTVLDESKPEEV